MTPKVNEILKVCGVESKLLKYRPISKEELLRTLGSQEHELMISIKAEPDKDGRYPEEAYFIANDDGNGGDYFIDTDIAKTITDEEYEELLPYAVLSGEIKRSEKSRKTLEVLLALIWIINIIGCFAILCHTGLTTWMQWGLIIGCITELAFIQIFANAIFENARNNEQVSISILSLGQYLLKKNISQIKE